VEFDDFKASLVEERNLENRWIDKKRVALQKWEKLIRRKLEDENRWSVYEPQAPKVRSMVLIPDIPYAI